MLKLINSKLKEFELIEFWLVTAIVTLSLVFSVIEAMQIRASMLQTSVTQFNGMITNISVTRNSLIIPILFGYLIIYLAYLLLCFFVIPEFRKKEGSEVKSTLFVFILIAAGTLLNIINIYFATLLAIKIWAILFTVNSKNNANALNYEAALLTGTWLLMVVGIRFLSVSADFSMIIIFVVPATLIIYLYAVHGVQPRLRHRSKPLLRFIGNILWLAVLSSVILGTVTYSFSHGGSLFPWMIFSPDQLVNFGIKNNDYAIITPVNFFAQIFIVGPVSRSVFKRRNNRVAEEIKSLKTELSQSDANLNFLKSQINPHFLFNALNTLYGTALQENAERTGEGIEKLGHMMRFMLYENTLDKIALSRDVDYLNNYILLQQLRTSTSPDIKIEIEIDSVPDELSIAPMLLIPFVENAFKHGVSRINPSFIKISLQVMDTTLYFDVHNSIRQSGTEDPEKDQGGIGIENVKQRLLLLYPDRHELIIRESAKEYFVHLTLQLDGNA